jgi:GGDEF domain-containing protein
VADTLHVVLDTVAELTGASRCSLWQLDPTTDELVVKATTGWADIDPAERRLPVNGSIEGWVLRNDRLFTAKDLTRYDTLRRVDRGTVIYSAPLRAGARAWGVIDIEDLPFERFAAHTEHMLLLVAAVAAAPLEQAIAYESGLEPAGRSTDTGCPLFEQLERVLRTEVAERAADGGTLSVVLIQMNNYHRLATVIGLDRTGDVIRRVLHAIRQVAPGIVRCFHYKNEGQLAVICPGLDFDGAALFALDFLRWSAEASWLDDIGEVRPEFTAGYSSLAHGVDDTEALLRMAENLLSMQNR